MTERDESIIGDIPVYTQLALGTEHLRLFLTSRRLIIARVGKRGAGALAGLSLLGRFSAGLDGLFRGRRKSLKTENGVELTPERILEAHKDNFFITFEEVVRVELEPSPNNVKMTILTTYDKFLFQTPVRIENLLPQLTGALGTKVTSRTA